MRREQNVWWKAVIWLELSLTGQSRGTSGDYNNNSHILIRILIFIIIREEGATTQSSTTSSVSSSTVRNSGGRRTRRPRTQRGGRIAFKFKFKILNLNHCKHVTVNLIDETAQNSERCVHNLDHNLNYHSQQTCVKENFLQPCVAPQEGLDNSLV